MTPDDLPAKLARLAELETQFEAAVERAKMAALYQLTYGLSHEFNNPLANISSRAQALLADEKDPERRRKLAAINAQAFRAHEMLADLMLFAKPPRLDKQPLELVALLRQGIQELQASATEQETELALTDSLPVMIHADRPALLEAVKAVIKNGLEAIGEGGCINLSMETSSDSVAIVITDTGPGIPADVRPCIFDVYYSGREAGRGLGLGLSKCWRIMDEHGGRVEVDSTSTGAVFKLILPVASL